MKNVQVLETETAAASPSTTVVIQFKSDKTPGEIYNHVIGSIDQSLDFIIAMAKPELLRAMEMWLLDRMARVKNAQSALAVRS